VVVVDGGVVVVVDEGAVVLDDWLVVEVELDVLEEDPEVVVLD
jgi:hypothetical protein